MYRITHSSVTLTWEAVECIHRNGDINGYSIEYEDNGLSHTIASDRTMRQIVVSGLQFSTEYSFRVAAISSAGDVGVYSPYPTAAVTDGRFAHTFINLNTLSVHF